MEDSNLVWYMFLINILCNSLVLKFHSYLPVDNERCGSRNLCLQKEQRPTLMHWPTLWWQKIDDKYYHYNFLPKCLYDKFIIVIRLWNSIFCHQLKNINHIWKIETSKRKLVLALTFLPMIRSQPIDLHSTWTELFLYDTTFSN